MAGGRLQPARETLEYDGRGEERGRLEAGHGPLERERTREVLLRDLPPPPADVAEIGGADVHALWLTFLGYAVHLRDPVTLHVEQAEAGARELGLRLATVPRLPARPRISRRRLPMRRPRLADLY